VLPLIFDSFFVAGLSFCVRLKSFEEVDVAEENTKTFGLVYTLQELARNEYV
jgi:hypothetical protein